MFYIIKFMSVFSNLAAKRDFELKMFTILSI